MIAEIEKLEKIIEQRNAELEELQAIYNQRIQRLRELEKLLGKAQSNYKAIKGDQIDELLANFLSISGCPIPIRRLGDGFYMFGSRKIYAKVINGKLVI